MTSLIPNFSYHKTLYDGKILKKLGEVAGKSENQICKIQALTLLRKLIDFGEVRFWGLDVFPWGHSIHGPIFFTLTLAAPDYQWQGTKKLFFLPSFYLFPPLSRRIANVQLHKNNFNSQEHNIEVLNELSLPPTIDNLTIPKKEDLSTQTPYRDILYNTLKIFAFLLDDFACLEEEKLIKSMLILLQGNQIDNDPKIEKLVIQIIKILWDQSQGTEPAVGKGRSFSLIAHPCLLPCAGKSLTHIIDSR